MLLFPFINLFYWGAMYLYTPTLSTYAKDIGASNQMVGLIIGAYGLTQMCLRLPFGVLSDRICRRKIFVCIGMFFTGLGGLVSAIFPTAPGLFVSRCVAGIGASAWVNCTVLYPAYYPPDQTDRAVSRLNAYSSISTTAAMLMGGYFVQRFGQVAAGYIAAAYGGIALLLSLFISDHRPEPTHRLNMKDIRIVLTNKTLWKYSIMALTFHFIWNGTSSCFTPIVAQRFYVSSSQLGYLSSCGHVGIFIASAVIGAYILPKLSAKHIMGIGFAVMGLLIVCTVFATEFWMLLVIQMLTGTIGYSVFLGALVRCVRTVPDMYRGIAVGLTQAIYGSGMFMGPAVMGFLLQNISLNQAYFVAGGTCVFMALLGYRWASKMGD